MSCRSTTRRRGCPRCMSSSPRWRGAWRGARARGRGRLCGRRQPRRHAGDRAHAAGLRARRAGGGAVAQFRQGGRARRRARSCAPRRGAVHGRRRAASAGADRARWSRHWHDDGYDVVYTAKAHRENESWRCAGSAARRSMRCSTGARATRSPRMPATSACSRRAPPTRCGRLPERNRFFKGLASWIGFKQLRVDYQPAERSPGRRRSAGARCSACRSRG